MPEIRRAGDRFHTAADGVETWHSFSYGRHYDPDNIGFGPLIAINTERVEGGRGYDLHHHADVEIVTWVLAGKLHHEDGTGHRGTITPGIMQRLSAGTGVQHSEHNASLDEPLEFIQMMLASDHSGEPQYAQAEVAQTPGGLLAAVAVHAPAELFVVRLDPGQSTEVPAAARSLVHVTRGHIQLGNTVLTSGDEARLTGEGAYDLSAADDSGGEALIWQLKR